MSGTDNFLPAILTRIAHRYERQGQLRGVMKIGHLLHSQQLKLLYNFFGIAPIRINGKEEVRISFDLLLQETPEKQWLEKLSAVLGYTLTPVVGPDADKQTAMLLSSLHLAFPELEKLIDHLKKNSGSLQGMFTRNSDATVRTNCFQLAETLRFLLHNSTPITISELGARFFGNSKVLRQGEMRGLLFEWLRFYSPDAEIAAAEDAIWANYMVLSDRLTVNALAYGPIIYEKKGITFDWIYRLYTQGEAATIGWSNIQDIDCMYWNDSQAAPPDLICCENEAPYSHLLHQRERQVLLFTSGFPGSAVRKLYQLLAPQAAHCRHWGDSDPAGLRIAALLHALHPLQLYRCDITTLQRHKEYLLPLSPQQQDNARDILTRQPDFPFAEELCFTLNNGWLEQESWRPSVKLS